jgi:hypothetical protein
MNISELYEVLQDEFSSNGLNGELQLHGNVIIWSHDTNDNGYCDNSYNDYDDEEEEYVFGLDFTSLEEMLNEAYQEDLLKLQEFLGSIDEFDNWSISDSEIIDEIISFKIF